MDEFPEISEERPRASSRSRIAALGRRLWQSILQAGILSSAPAPARPIVVIHSDDWGRVGAPTREAIENLRRRGYPVASSPWDHYGLESQDDVLALGTTLAAVRDSDGRPACITANFIMANPDLRAMSKPKVQSFAYVPIKDGFPRPWRRNVLPAYLQNIASKVFYPGLHGFTHFNVPLFLELLSSDSEAGERVRALVQADIPYLATVTPEFNFALVDRRNGERFLSEPEQRDWIAHGVDLFQATFGFSPRTTCAPGYRANDTTYRIWEEMGVEAVQVSGIGLPARDGRLFVVQRNVTFEPVLTDGGVVERALRQAKMAVRSGCPIVICTHSLNFVTAHIGRADESRQMLQELLRKLLDLFPNLRFASDAELLDSLVHVNSDWWRKPTAVEVLSRFVMQAHGP
jgi:hypothetical protein